MNIRTIKSAVEGARQYVQDEKIQISRRTITKFQYADRWPEEYYAYVNKETRSNRYKDPERFFRVMHFKPDLYLKRFIFRPIIDVSGVLREATLYATRITLLHASMFRIISGLYVSSFRIMVDGAQVEENELDNLTSDSVVQIYNTAPYASKLESIAFYRAAMGGVLYFAANQVKSKYPQLGVSFSYKKADDMPGTYSFYQVPVLTLGSRANVIDTLRKPGNRVRRRKRAAAKTQRIRDKVRR